MSDNTKQIHDWQEKVRSEFGDGNKLYQYLFETLDNFFYRYLETTESKDLKTQELMPKTYGALSFESSMVEALKAQNPQAKKGIMELAKSVPKAQKPMVRYGLWTKVEELSADHGRLLIMAEINWDFPEFTDPSKRLGRTVDFRYQDLAVFRKELALMLEDACSIF